MAEADDRSDQERAQQIAAARARLTLRAERAFGNGGVIGFTSPAPPTRPAAPPLSSPSPATRESARASAPLPDRRAPGERPTSPARPATPAVDLFGNAVVKEGDPAALPPFEGDPPPRNRRIELLTALDDNEVRGCTKCDLSENRTHTVFGEGDPEAELFFIGEGPGENEDLTGRPFVGKAGGLLDKMIAGMGLDREDVYIANVVKCRPPGNRMPTAGEVATCTPYLHKQLDWIRPKVIVTLGLPATRHLLGLNLPMGKMRGQWHEWRGLRVMPTYHPAYLLRSYTEANRRAVWGDLQEVMKMLDLKPSRGGTR